MGAVVLLLLLSCLGGVWGCQLSHDWRPQSESCRAELAEIIVFAKVLALHKDSYSVYNYLPWQYDTELFYSAEIELLCDQAWGSMLEVPAGSRFNVTGLGYFPCYSYTVTENNSYYFFLRMDENYNIVPHGVNFQDPIFPDTSENRRMFASLFQFSNCSAGMQLHMYTPEWEAQEDTRLLCSMVQKALFEEEERVRKLSLKVRSLEKANNHLREKVKKMKRSLRQAKKESKREAMLIKQLLEKDLKKGQGHSKQDTDTEPLKKPLKKLIGNKLK
ncbi:coiled-coil domain-containing protein 3 [Latimeria chalumnae]|uniref:Coiled-coil domain containing 3b n=1 Tax=Latimeria chalumnae TaxID=7897 RepID=H3AF21_LATCH|nr:PREDICTED: coiled-coil domain-containing protein 3-like [Latimeria chalumnae]|eukprot:XP_006001263.1 PREDICTED: coiled-coil domain-containing protein 3-like [Latimeria chalumnae]